MPKNARSHIQKIAPGPPTESAVATPAMLPMPTVPPREVAAAWKGDMDPESPFPPRPMASTVCRRMCPTPRTWKKPDLTVKNTATPAMNTIVQGPHRRPSTTASQSRKRSIMRSQILALVMDGRTGGRAERGEDGSGPVVRWGSFDE